MNLSPSMQASAQIHLPLPKWCFVLLGVLTFYLPLAYAAVVLWTILGIFSGEISDPPEWMMLAVHPALYVTIALWPFYLAWVGFSRRLAWREKSWWFFIVTMLNMVGMPMFYVFMVRRYLGREWRPGEQDETALELFLKRHEIDRERLTPGQISVLLSYCHQCRLARWIIVPQLLTAALLIYMAAVFLPENGIRLFSGFQPTRLVIIDSATDARKEYAPDSETQELYLRNVMLFGGMAGAMGTMGLFVSIQTLIQLRLNGRRKILIDLLKAADGNRLPNRFTRR